MCQTIKNGPIDREDYHERKFAPRVAVVTALSPRSTARAAVLVFARWWADGPVKTRLAAEIGDADAREIYRQLAESAWAALEHPDLARHLWASPESRLREVRGWLPGADRSAAQPEADLGQRMSQAFEMALDGSAPWAAAVGTDVPDLDAAMVLRAGTELQRADLALVPAFDGGYSLLALRRPQPALFSDIPWSSARVLERTLARAADLGLAAALLPPARDVDTLEDLRYFADRFPRVRLSKPE